MSVEILVGGRARLHRGDCLDVLAKLPPDLFHSAVTDPPYHFASTIKRWSKSGEGARTAAGAMGRHSRGFMGQTWDGGDIAFQPDTWRAVLRVLRPGAHLVAFAAPKNMGRLQVAIEDAGFEVRDTILDVIAAETPVVAFLQSLAPEQQEAFLRCIADSQFGGLLAWVFGQGFPKNHATEKAIGKTAALDLFRADPAEAGELWAGFGTALKPAFEPIILARKPLVENVASTALEHGTGALNIDACRVEGRAQPFGNSTEGSGGYRLHNRGAPNWSPSDLGRWPANLVHDGSDEVVSVFPAKAGAVAPVRRRNGDKFRNTFGAFSGDIDEAASTFRGDEGSAARFFYASKATNGERVGFCAKCGERLFLRDKAAHKHGEASFRHIRSHPTVKPVDLMRWLCRLVTSPGGRILDPFAGTGTTGAAAIAEGFSVDLIEREADYQADIAWRLGSLSTLTEAAE